MIEKQDYNTALLNENTDTLRGFRTESSANFNLLHQDNGELKELTAQHALAPPCCRRVKRPGRAWAVKPTGSSSGSAGVSFASLKHWLANSVLITVEPDGRLKWVTREKLP